MEAKKNTDTIFPTIFTNNSDFKSPVIGLTTGDIRVNYCYQNASSLSIYYPTDAEFVSAGSGIYWLTMGASEFLNEGNYQLSINATGSLNYNFNVECRDNTFAELYDFIYTISGNINNLPLISTIVTSGDAAGWAADSTINYSTIVDSGNAAGWNGTSVITALTQVSGAMQTEHDATQSTLSTINGNVNDIETKVDTIDTNVDAVKLKTDFLPDSAIDGKTMEEVLEILLAMAQGKIVRSGDTYIYKKQDNSTTLFTLQVATSERTRS